MRKIVIVLVVLLTSCVNTPKATVQDGEFKIEFLFEKNGCKMYRFDDGGRYIYWSDCSGRTSSDYTKRVGKSTQTQHMECINN